MSLRPVARSLSALALMAALCAAPVRAGTFTDGEFFAYGQALWSVPSLVPPESFLSSGIDASSAFATLFPAGIRLGDVPTFHADFDTGADVVTFLHSSFGPPGVLDSNQANPQSTSAGQLGAQIVTLILNVTYGDAGPLHDADGHLAITHPAGVTFGDLVLTGLAGSDAGFNGMSLRQLELSANDFVGGGVEPYSPADLNALLISINGSFSDGFVHDFARANLDFPQGYTAPVPEPSTWLMLLAGLGAIGKAARRRRGL